MAEMAEMTLPVAESQRSQILDILRGFALLGICMANAGYFSLYIFQSPQTHHSFAFPEVDRWLRYFHIAFVDGKFYTIFSLLFGIGFSIFLYDKQGTNKLWLFYRRLFFLLLIGLAHALLIWDGDILMFYAITGLFLPLFRNLPIQTIIALAVLLILSPLLFDLIKIVSDNKLNISRPLLQLALETDKTSGINEGNVHNWLILNDSYSDLLNWNQSGFWWSWKTRLDSNRIPKVLGTFLIGLAIGKSKIHTRIDLHRPMLTKLLYWLLLIGLTAAVAKVIFDLDGVKVPDSKGLLDTLAYALNVAPLGIAYCIAFALWFDHNPKSRIFEWLQPVGRMALTNYIMQAIISISIYYGIGAGFASSVGPSFFIPVSIAIFLLQVIYSRWWMNRFAFGPLEWIWRQLTYGKRLSIRKQVDAH